jgi:hypothetical protein
MTIEIKVFQIPMIVRKNPGRRGFHKIPEVLPQNVK